MEPILHEPLGSKISVCDVFVYNPYMHKGECEENVLYIVYIDSTGKKKVRGIRNPTFDIYFTKPQYRKEWDMPRQEAPMDKVYPVAVTQKTLLTTIYKELKKENTKSAKYYANIYETACNTGRWGARKEILKWEHVFLADLSLEDYYRLMLNVQYDCNNVGEVKMAFLDIESDTEGLTSSELAANMAPTHATTVIFTHNLNGEKIPQVYTFLLKDYKRYPQQKDFEENLDKVMEMVHKEFDEVEIVRKKKKKTIVTNFQYHVMFYDTEEELIVAIFSTLNLYRPDLCAIWNAEYDIPQLYYRLRRLGLEPLEVMCDSIFPRSTRFIDMKIDHRGFVTAAERKTYFKMTSCIRYIDQMLSYASIRRGRKSFGGTSLDNISEIELGAHKRKFSPGVTIKNAAILEYSKFFLYSINDVVLQFLCEYVTKDLLSLFIDMNQSNCSYENLSKQTKYNRQFFFHKFIKRGYIPGCNVNIDYLSGMSEDKIEYLKDLELAKKRRTIIDKLLADGTIETEDEFDESMIESYDTNAGDDGSINDDVFCDSIDKKIEFAGAIIGHPNLNSNIGAPLFKNVFSKHIFDFSMDYDFAAEYPKAKVTRSITKETQYGRLIIGEKISDRQNTYNSKQYLPGGEFVSDYISGDMLSFGNTWFNLPTTDEMASIIEKKLLERRGHCSEEESRLENNKSTFLCMPTESREFNANLFIDIVKRIPHSEMNTLVVHNQMLMGVYDVTEDEVVGMNYLLHIPPKEKNPLYDINFYIDYSHITKQIKELDSALSLYKKEHKDSGKKKPKFTTRGEYYNSKDGVIITIAHYCEDYEIATASILCPYLTSDDEDRIAETYTTMLSRVSQNCAPIVIDGNNENLYEKAMNSVRPYYHCVDYSGVNLYIPFMKSFFHSMKKLDKFKVSVRKTELDEVYLVSMVMIYKGIAEQYVYYLNNIVRD